MSKGAGGRGQRVVSFFFFFFGSLKCNNIYYSLRAYYVPDAALDGLQIKISQYYQ